MTLPYNPLIGGRYSKVKNMFTVMEDGGGSTVGQFEEYVEKFEKTVVIGGNNRKTTTALFNNAAKDGYEVLSVKRVLVDDKNIALRGFGYKDVDNSVEVHLVDLLQFKGLEETRDVLVTVYVAYGKVVE